MPMTMDRLSPKVDLPLLLGTLAIVTAVSYFLYHSLARERPKKKSSSGIPRVRTHLPFIGSAPEYFQNLSGFVDKYRAIYGDVFYAKILGNDWLFLHNKQDVEKVVKSSEKLVSMYKAIADLAERFLPQESARDYNSKNRQEIFRRVGEPGMSHSPATLHFIAAVKPARLRAWVPGMVDTIQEHYFAELPHAGEMDLFQFCFQLVSGMTARVLLGGNIVGDKAIGKRWIDLVRRAEPERAFSGPMASLAANFEVALKGERQVFVRARDFIYPFVDAEIERCIRGEPEYEDYPVIGALVRSVYKTANQDPDILRALRKRIANYLFNFTFAGVTNSYGAAAWTIYYILRNIDGVGDRVLLELTNPDQNMDHAPQLENLILEIGRLYTPGSLLRKTTQPFVIPSTGQVVPTGTMISINASVLHRNPDMFSDPLEFRPARFNNEATRRKAGATFVTFGAGMHPCSGRRFAIMEIALFVREVFKTFDLHLVDVDQRARDPVTYRYVSNVPHHPKLDPTQNNSIWRPLDKVLINYKKKQ